MKLNLEQVRSVTQGAESVERENGYFRFYRFIPEEARMVGDEIVIRPAGVGLEFRTDGSALILKGRSFDIMETIRSYFCVDVFVDGILAGCVRNIPEAECVGNYAEKKYPLGDFEERIALPAGEKTVRIQLPHSAGVEFSEIGLENAALLEPVPREKTLILYGDSITQGYDSAHASGTYAVRVAEGLGMELFNKGVGGMGFTPQFAAIPNPRKADLLIVAYGTNDWTCQSREALQSSAAGFVQALRQRHPETPICVLTPVWREDYQAEKKFGPFTELETVLRAACRQIPGVKVISGFDLIPHDKSYYGDLWLHPSDEGFRHFAENLLRQIQL